MKQREILFIVISVFILVIAYIAFNIYHNAKISTISPALSIQIAPIDPTFDMRVIESIKKRERVAVDLQTAQGSSGSSIVLPLPLPSSPFQKTSTDSSQIQKQ